MRYGRCGQPAHRVRQARWSVRHDDGGSVRPASRISAAGGAGQATVFGAVAELYDRARPGYPPQALEFVLPTDPGLVLELGAGTGQLTRSLTGRRVKVIAMDPDAHMLAVLRERLPGVEVRRGSAEQIPLPGL